MSGGNYSDERTQILNLSTTSTTPPKSNDCSCCVTPSCCQTYNRIGIFFFVIWFSLQIVSISTSWHDYFIFQTRDDDRIVLSYLAQGVSIYRTYQQSSQIIQATIFCPYVSNSMNTHNLSNILTNPQSRSCPPSGQLSSIFPPIVGTTVVAIIAEFAMIIWLAFRSSKKGVDCLFNNKCSTQIISIILSVFIIGFTSATFSLLPGRLGSALIGDYGGDFWVNLGCDVDVYSSRAYLYCRQYTCSYYPCTIEQDGAGYIIAIVNMALLCLGCLYTLIGSWCCSCCSCMEEKPNPYATINTTYPGGSGTGVMTSTQVPYLNINTTKSFTLFVHHGSPLPTKLVLMASTFQDLHVGIAQNIGVTVPFSIAVFDEQVKQYVMVTSLAAIPPQATVQLIFQ